MRLSRNASNRATSSTIGLCSHCSVFERVTMLNLKTKTNNNQQRKNNSPSSDVHHNRCLWQHGKFASADQRFCFRRQRQRHNEKVSLWQQRVQIVSGTHLNAVNKFASFLRSLRCILVSIRFSISVERENAIQTKNANQMHVKRATLFCDRLSEFTKAENGRTLFRQR